MNGTVNQNDADLLTRYWTGSIRLNANQLLLADVDNSGAFNSSDTTAIESIISGKNTLTYTSVPLAKDN